MEVVFIIFVCLWCTVHGLYFYACFYETRRNNLMRYIRIKAESCLSGKNVKETKKSMDTVFSEDELLRIVSEAEATEYKIRYYVHLEDENDDDLKSYARTLLRGEIARERLKWITR